MNQTLKDKLFQYYEKNRTNFYMFYEIAMSNKGKNLDDITSAAEHYGVCHMLSDILFYDFGIDKRDELKEMYTFLDIIKFKREVYAA